MTTNAENLRGYESRFSFFVEQILAFTSRSSGFASKFQMNHITTFYVIDNSNSDRQIHFIAEL